MKTSLELRASLRPQGFAVVTFYQHMDAPKDKAIGTDLNVEDALGAQGRCSASSPAFEIVDACHTLIRRKQ